MMKNTAVLFVSFGLLTLAFSGLRAQAPARPEDALTAKARALLSALEKGDFEAAARDFDATMLEVSGPDKLEPMWSERLPAQVGKFKRQGPARRDRLQGYEIVLVACEFEKAKLDARVVFDKEGKIAGLQFVPPAPPAKYGPPAYADPAKFEEAEVTVGSGEWALPGTLTAPKGPGPFPGLVLVHGSGPNDRDETLGPNKPFKDLAWGLATRGVAVLRYEKRTRVHGGKILADPGLEAAMTVKDETIDDALAAAALLGRDKRVDPRRVFILGHSLGGYLLPRIALAAAPLGVAGFIGLAGPTRPIEASIIYQIGYIHGLAGGALTDDDRKELEDIMAEVARIRALTDADKGSTTRLLGAMPAYWLDLRGYDLAEAARKVAKPMLFLQGGRDYQVTTEDLGNWKKALGGRADVEFRLYPKLNHLFFEGEGSIAPLEYVQKHGSVALAVVEDIAAFIMGKMIPLSRFP
ncbi:MAG TPA: alpha/beta fold hydrolase [Candidatus Aminicenantes bacterium]|nr:alpha/beta fold hydrolase [Candidatus Aminicenantes bacterium]